MRQTGLRKPLITYGNTKGGPETPWHCSLITLMGIESCWEQKSPAMLHEISPYLKDITHKWRCWHGPLWRRLSSLCILVFLAPAQHCCSLSTIFLRLRRSTIFSLSLDFFIKKNQWLCLPLRLPPSLPCLSPRRRGKLAHHAPLPPILKRDGWDADGRYREQPARAESSQWCWIHCRRIYTQPRIHSLYG